MKLNRLIFTLIFVLSSQNFISAQTFDLAVFLEATQAVARKTAYQGWVEYASDFKLTEIASNGKKISYEDSKLGKREWNELMEILELKEKIIS